MPIFCDTRLTCGGGRACSVLAVQQPVDRDRGLVAVRDRPDDVLGAEGRVAAEEDVRHASTGRSSLSSDRQAPLVELDAAVALDPGEGVLLADRDQHVVALEERVGLAGGHELAPALVVVLGLDLLERHAGRACRLRCTKALGTRKLRIGMPSCIASSFSHGDAFISSKPRAHDHLHVARRRGAARCGSSPSRCCRRRAR